MRKNYKFTNKRHPKHAIMATMLGLISFLSLIMVIYSSYIRENEAEGSYGVTGFLIMIFSLIGIILECNTLKIPDKYGFFVWSGMILNIITFLSMIGVVAVGIYL